MSSFFQTEFLPGTNLVRVGINISEKSWLDWPEFWMKVKVAEIACWDLVRMLNIFGMEHIGLQSKFNLQIERSCSDYFWIRSRQKLSLLFGKDI